MLISLHKNATTTPATRLAMQQAHGREAALAQRFGLGKLTVRKWRKRTSVEDASHTPHRLQTTLNAGQEEVVVYLRTHLRLSLDDLLAVVREFIEPAMGRCALDRPLRRRGVNRLPEPEVTATPVKCCKAYEPGDVPRDTQLFAGTLLDNLTYGNRSCKSSWLDEVIRSLGIDAIVSELPHGLQSEIGESGKILSGGQCQRIAIARAILAGRAILVFDEATSALDEPSEMMVVDAIHRLCANRTRIFISHREQPVSRADRVLEIRNGQLYEATTRPAPPLKTPVPANAVAA